MLLLPCTCAGRGMCCDGMCKCDEDNDGYQYRSRTNEGTDCDCLPEEIVCRQVRIQIIPTHQGFVQNFVCGGGGGGWKKR